MKRIRRCGDEQLQSLLLPVATKSRFGDHVVNLRPGKRLEPKEEKDVYLQIDLYFGEASN